MASPSLWGDISSVQLQVDFDAPLPQIISRITGLACVQANTTAHAAAKRSNADTACRTRPLHFSLGKTYCLLLSRLS
jgi:hypothetical protein